MNKTELIDKIAEKSNLTKVDAKKALDATVEAIKEALVAGDKVALIGSVLPARVSTPAIKWLSRFLRRRWLSLRLVLNWQML